MKDDNVDIKSPLTGEHLAIINKLLKSCAATREYCKKCQACGAKMDEEMEANDEQEQIGTRIKAHFFPDAT